MKKKKVDEIDIAILNLLMEDSWRSNKDHVLYHPMDKIVDRLNHISTDQNIILACPGGIRSTRVANLLNIKGYPSVANLDGGFALWKAKGLPWQKQPVSGGGCGCGCSSSNSDAEGSCC